MFVCCVQTKSTNNNNNNRVIHNHYQHHYHLISRTVHIKRLTLKKKKIRHLSFCTAKKEREGHLITDTLFFPVFFFLLSFFFKNIKAFFFFLFTFISLLFLFYFCCYCPLILFYCLKYRSTITITTLHII